MVTDQTLTMVDFMTFDSFAGENVIELHFR